MEEQRQRQEDEARRTAVTSAAETGLSASAADGEKNGLKNTLRARDST